MRQPRRGARPAGLAVLALALAIALAARGADASIHDYSGGGFAPRANSFFFHGGSEGLYASDPSSNSSTSFIRYAGRTPTPLRVLWGSSCTRSGALWWAAGVKI
jgi:hypothetical protein